MIERHPDTNEQSPAVGAGVVGPSGRLSPEAAEELRAARLRGRKVRRATTTAAISGWSMAVFGGFSLLGGVFSVSSLLMGGVISALAWRELRGAAMLRRHDERAPRLLWTNQAALLMVIVAYATFSLHAALTGPTLADEVEAQAPQAAGMLDGVAELERIVSIGLYGALAAGSLAFQGGLAAYYATRTRHVRAYRAQTPEWVMDLQRAA